MILFKFFCILVWLYQINGIALDMKSGPEKLSLNNSVFNTEILTQFNYHGNEVYIYGAVSNNIKNSDAPGKWTFYYVPLMIPINNNRSEDKWIYTVENDVRIKLMLGNNEIKELAEKEIIKKYDPNITKYSQSWVITPLMIDSLTAYIVRKINSPIKNVYPFKIENPDGLEIEFRFQCSSEILAKKIKKKIINEIYGIEVIFYFAGSRQVTINAISFTGEILKAMLSRTVADGGKSDIKYIQRNQRVAFINKYKTNIKTMSYIKKQNVHNPLMLITLRKQFDALLQQALISSTEIKLAVNFYNQIWSTYDLNPDRITREINKLFTCNKTSTKNGNHSDQYFDYQKENITLTTGSGGGGLIFKIFALNTRDEISESNSSITTNIAKSVYSLSEIQDLLKQESIEITWTDEKFILKSFLVYRLSDITDRLDLYINSQQLLAEKKAGGFARMINLRSHPLTVSQVQSTSFLGEIKLYLGNISSLPSHWMFCHGQNLSRIEYHKLFSVVGESFGAGDGHTTFNLPDLRGRVVIERNSSEKNTDATFQMGVTSDHAKHVLTKKENSSVLLHSYQTLDYIIFIGDQSVTNMNPDGKKSIITSTFNITCSPQCLNGGYCTAPNVCTCTGLWKGSQCEKQMKFNKWKQNGTTVAGGNRSGNQLNQLQYPYGIFVDQNKNIFIADNLNHRIMKWKLGEKQGTIVAGGNGWGNTTNQLKYPTDVIVDRKDNSLIIADQLNRRVIQWFNENQQEILIENIHCLGLAMDKYGFLYVSDSSKHEVRRWKIGEKAEGTLVAGGNGAGNQLNQLFLPTYIFVDNEQSIYISDQWSHRVMKWSKDAKEGVIVAGGNGSGKMLNQLHYPQGLFVDDYGRLYVVDALNRRVMRWSEGAKEGEIIAGGNGEGNNSNQLSPPYDLSFDIEGNLYVSDQMNHRIQRFDLIS